MFKKLRDVPDGLGNINGVEYPADIPVKITTNEKLRRDVIELLEKGPKTISLDKEYHVTKVISYGDPFDVVIINDLGKEEILGEWFFEDID